MLCGLEKNLLPLSLHSNNENSMTGFFSVLAVHSPSSLFLLYHPPFSFAPPFSMERTILILAGPQLGNQGGIFYCFDGKPWENLMLFSMPIKVYICWKVKLKGPWDCWIFVELFIFGQYFCYRVTYLLSFLSQTHGTIPLSLKFSFQILLVSLRY